MPLPPAALTRQASDRLNDLADADLDERLGELGTRAAALASSGSRLVPKAAGGRRAVAVASSTLPSD